jgi:pimeloyl-ACP methyl ester carboxylesterase
MGGFIEDDLAGVGAWGFDPADVAAPVLFVHGGRDQVLPASHGEWLACRCPSAQLWLYPEDGHTSTLNSGAAAAMGWLRERADGN